MDKKLMFKQTEPLHKEDSATQTFGCRANNPNICANCYLDNVCAFVTNDHICHKPSRAWPKAFEKLKSENK